MKYNFELEKKFDLDAFCKEPTQENGYAEMDCKGNEYEEDYRSFAYYDTI